MKGRLGAILRPDQASYLERLLPGRDELAAEMEAHARANGVPISDPEVARLLEILARARGAARMLEIGTAIGYGTLALARGAGKGRVTTIDPDSDRQLLAARYLERAGVLERVEMINGPALDVLPTLQGPFDLVYIDALKSEYRRYLDRSLPLLGEAGLIVIDNLLWKGRVAEPPEEEDSSAEAIRAFNGYFMIHPQLNAVLLPLGDGVGLAVKTRPVMTEMGGPY